MLKPFDIDRPKGGFRRWVPDRLTSRSVLPDTGDVSAVEQEIRLGYQITRPTDQDFEIGHNFMKFGALATVIGVGGLIAIVKLLGHEVSTPWQNCRVVLSMVISLGLAAILWGLRVYATQAEYDSATRNNGLTPAYEAACTMLALLLVVIPIATALVAIGVIELPKFPSERAK